MEIKIGKSAHNCCSCEGSFEHEQPLNALLFIREQQFVREDYCDACWNSEQATGAYSSWRFQYYDPKVAEQEPPEVFSPLRQLFYETVEDDSRGEMAKAYLAAQLLRRQKVFRRIKGSDGPEGGGQVELFSDRIGNRLIEVRDPNLTYDELEEARRALMERLNELENPEPSGEDGQDDESQESENEPGEG